MPRWDCHQGMEVSARCLPAQDNSAGHTSSRGAGVWGCGGEFVNKPCDRSGQPAATWGADKERQTKEGTHLCPHARVKPGDAGDVLPVSCLLLGAPRPGVQPHSKSNPCVASVCQ